MIGNVRAWLVWVTAAAVVTMVARNPLYTLIVLLVSQLMMVAFARRDNEFQLPIWRLGVLIVAISAIYNALFVHIGQTILFELPDWPLIGGPITLEALVGGAANGFTLLALLAVFVAFNAIVPVSELVRVTPASFQDLGVVVLIAITYVPETIRHLRRIREAQAVRGHQLRGVRDWQPVVVPLLVGGLERALRLAETMVARGYGATSSTRHGLGDRLTLTAALIVAFAGWIVALWKGWPGWLLLLVGLIMLAAIIRRSGRRSPRTSFRQKPWSRIDTLLLLTAAVALLIILLPWPFVDRSTLVYSPYPKLMLPGFDLLIGLVLAGLALPVVFG